MGARRCARRRWWRRSGRRSNARRRRGSSGLRRRRTRTCGGRSQWQGVRCKKVSFSAAAAAAADVHQHGFVGRFRRGVTGGGGSGGGSFAGGGGGSGGGGGASGGAAAAREAAPHQRASQPLAATAAAAAAATAADGRASARRRPASSISALGASSRLSLGAARPATTALGGRSPREAIAMGAPHYTHHHNTRRDGVPAPTRKIRGRLSDDVLSRPRR